MLSQTITVIITIAIATDSIITSWFSGALHKKLHLKLDLRLPIFFSAGRVLFLAIGLFTGIVIEPMVSGYGNKTGLLLLAVAAIKLIVEYAGFNAEERVFLIDNNRTLLLLTVAGSINSFFAGIGFGLTGTGVTVPLVAIVTTVFSFTVAGINAGKFYGYIPAIRFSGVVAGILILIIVLRLFILNFI